MIRLLICFSWLLFQQQSFSQTIASRLSDAVQKFETDHQLKHGILGFHVVETKTGNPVFSKNEQIGLAPASCQKILVSIAALELLGSAFTYDTRLGYEGRIEGKILKGNLHITGSGDPTFGSQRYSYTTADAVMRKWIAEMKKRGIDSIDGQIIMDKEKWETATIPDGWIWQDIGNYYGAGASVINWLENQYDLKLKSGNTIGDTCMIVSTTPYLHNTHLVCEVTAAEKGSGDNAYIYFAPYSTTGYVRGTIPRSEPAFTISGSMPDAAAQFAYEFRQALHKAGIGIKGPAALNSGYGGRLVPVSSVTSPPLDSINYWFLKRSINLYGEALLKTIALQTNGFGSTADGIVIVKSFWSQRTIENSALHILDGSGLSPQNRITTNALVTAMQYARSKPCLTSFTRPFLRLTESG